MPHAFGSVGAVFLLILVSLFSSISADPPPTVTIKVHELGNVNGLSYGNYSVFLGIPYAKPPVGPLRWDKPHPADKFPDEGFNAFQFGKGCPQVCILPPNTCPVNGYDEDCLTLNIWTPLLDGPPLPVLVFLPGGHFEFGGSDTFLYDGSQLAVQGPAVIVTINYRLGFLGWLTTVGGPGNLQGNFGFLDQLLAFQWIQDNIDAFGGACDQVTLFGQSAGATSIRAHLLSPQSHDYFGQVIIQSDPLPVPLRSVADASTFGINFTVALGCSDIECMRSKQVSDILRAQSKVENSVDILRPIESFLPFVPTVDYKLIVDHTMAAFESGKYPNKVPTMIGSTVDDALMFLYQVTSQNITKQMYEAALAIVFHEKAGKIKQKFANSSTDYRELLNKIGTEYIFTCSARHIANLFSNQPGDNKVFVYQWAYPLACSLWGSNYSECCHRVCHASELPFEFAGYQFQQKYYRFKGDELRVSNSFLEAVLNFAINGDPNPPPAAAQPPPPPDWPAYNPTDKNVLRFQPNQNVVISDFEADCDFWDTLGYVNGWQP